MNISPKRIVSAARVEFHVSTSLTDINYYTVHTAVSYTHLDVYKRQVHDCVKLIQSWTQLCRSYVKKIIKIRPK